MEQLTLFESTEYEIAVADLPQYVGEELHHYDNPANWVDPANAPDEYVMLLSAEQRGAWMECKLRSRDGHVWALSISMNAKHSHLRR